MATTKKPAAKKAVKKAAPKAAKVATPKAAPVMTGSSEATIFDMKGGKAGTLALPAELFALKWNADLVHQVVTGLEANARPVTAHTKFRGEVRGGGKKPWQQKGTGRARHGSSRSPIWVGGGTAHGPRNDRNFDRKVNKKMRAKALNTVLSAKLADQEISFIDALSLSEGKTKEASKVLGTLASIKQLERISKKKTNVALIALPAKDVAVERAFRNIGKISVVEARNLNPVDALKYTYIIFVSPEQSVKSLSGKF